MRAAIAAEIIVISACLLMIAALLLLPADTAHPPRAVSALPVVTTPSAPVARDDSTAQAAVAPMPAISGQIADPLIGGRATWYPAHGMIAAAGPALRHYLGRWWRGTLVEVCHGRCLVVRVTDWCACPRTLLDLSDDAFRQLAPLSRGVIPVSIPRVVHVRHVPAPPPTDTDQ